MHDVMENATIEDLTSSIALRVVESEEKEQRESMARVRAAAREARR